MSEINYKELTAFLKKQDKTSFLPVYLIYGDEFLYKQALKEIKEKMLPGNKKNLNYDTVDGLNENIPKVIEKLNTFSLVPGTKLIGLVDSRIFYKNQDKDKLIEKTEEAAQNDDLKKASRFLLTLISSEKLSLDMLREPESENFLTSLFGEKSSEDWPAKLVNYCIENKLSVPESEEHADILQIAIEKGFAKGNHLIITTDMVDKRRKLFKVIKEKGLIVECSVPKGNLKFDRDKQLIVLKETMHSVLSQYGKKMNIDAFNAILEMQGNDIRAFTSSLEKLITYVGKKEIIVKEDVYALLKRIRQEPIYEMTNSLAERKTSEALMYIDNLLSNDFMPIQLLAALTNQIRKLLLVKDFIKSKYGGIWQKGMQYNVFKNSVMPSVIDFDTDIHNRWQEWNNILSGSTSEKKKKIKISTVLAQNPKSVYPIYQTFLKSDNFTRDELINAFDILCDVDMRIKGTGQNARTVLEQAVIKICRRV